MNYGYFYPGWSSKPRKLSPAERAEKRRADKLKDAQWGMVEKIKSLAGAESPFSLVPELFAAIEIPRGEKDNAASFRYGVFQELDERPGYFSYAGGWHGILRQCRNHPVQGPRLFDAINGRGEFAAKKGGSK